MALLTNERLQKTARDAGYALLGATNVTVAATRQTARSLPIRLKETPGTARQTFDSLAQRGQALATRVRSDDDVKEARGLLRIAQRQVTTARRTVGQAIVAQGEIVEEAAEEVAKPARKTATKR